LRLGGRRGKQSTPRVWLGGTGECSTVGKQEAARSARRGVGLRTSPKRASGNGMNFTSSRVECMVMVGESN